MKKVLFFCMALLVLLSASKCTGTYVGTESSDPEKNEQKTETPESEHHPLYADSLALMKDASVTLLREGVVWTSIYTEWKGALRSINILEIELSDKNRLYFGCPAERKCTSDQCEEYGAFAGVNGSYFSHTYVKIDGEVVKPGKDEGVNPFQHDGVFTLEDNVPGIAYVGSNAAASQLPYENVMCCGPLLINNGVHMSFADHSHNTTTHPRTGVAVTEDGKVLLVNVDGRFPGKAVGMPNALFAKLLDIFGAEYALNLDGGGSTTMWIEGYGVVNHPCDKVNWDNPVERKVESIIYLK